MQTDVRMTLPDGDNESSLSSPVVPPPPSALMATTDESPNIIGNRGRSFSTDTHIRHHPSWFSRRRFSLRTTLSADDGDLVASPSVAALSLGVGHLTLDGRVDRFRSTSSSPHKSKAGYSRHAPARNLWPSLSPTSKSTPVTPDSKVVVTVSPSSSERSLTSSTAESSVTTDSCGVVSPSASQEAVPSPTSLYAVTSESPLVQQLEEDLRGVIVEGQLESSLSATIELKRRQSSFLRVADLALIDGNDSKCANHETTVHANFSYAATDPPPGVHWDPDERWIALDDGAGSHAPVAPLAMAALAQFGLELCLKRESIWTPDGKTMKVLKAVKNSNQTLSSWQTAWQHGQPIVRLPAIGSAGEKEALVWSASSLNGNGYGSDIPAVRVMGILNLSPRAMTDWLIDSSRVQEYNKMSLGRTDILVLQDNLDEDGPFGKSVTKIMKSQSRPPLLRKTMQFISLLHARALQNDDENQNLQGGFIIVTRAVTPAAEETHSKGGDDLLHSEILTNVNLMLPVQDDPDRCLMINISHVKSPMVPMMLAKRIGLSAAAGFLQDLRAAVPAARARESLATTTAR